MFFLHSGVKLQLLFQDDGYKDRVKGYGQQFNLPSVLTGGSMRLLTDPSCLERGVLLFLLLRWAQHRGSEYRLASQTDWV